MTHHGAEQRAGLLAALGAYGVWGLLPIFFKLLGQVPPIEVIAHRILWSLFLILLILAGRGALPALGAIARHPRQLMALAGSALFISINWLVYIWAVHDNHVLAASLGYFLNPMVNVALGVLVLKERLRRGQIVAIGIAALGVAIMAAAALTTLWISILLAVSFAFYGLIRKLTPVAPMVGLGAETLILSPIAVGCLLWLSGHGGLSIGKDGMVTGPLVASGAVTMVPLVLFAMAAQRLSMATLGLMQYLAPTLQFLSAVLLYDEVLTTGQMASFALVWVGLILFAADSLTAARRNRLVPA